MPREVRDWLEFAAIINDKQAMIQLLFDAGVIENERRCTRPECGGTLVARQSN